ncbi:sensor histidine kinase [Dictyobacter arantiisoli]|uniref:histidine kinase n=1 Tax=Dictyobacter arantiisoli TaxID=2014874 RepID=A0A5A5TEY4_9CHLR|nr:HAMP domain-containing sensor histidine kinase [Dictyobacter arantiisoli]GCF09706.1 hypothetical protein KDI_32700 [Dictyobacter arantiisoli]
MRIRWWKNIRWRLALGSALIALVSTGLLALTTILVIEYYYSVDLQSHLGSLVQDKAQSVGILYEHNHLTHPERTTLENLKRSANGVMNANTDKISHDPEHLYLFLNDQGRLIYPLGITRNSAFTALRAFFYPSDLTHLSADQARLQNAIKSALKGTSADGSLGRQTPVNTSLPFAVAPIFGGGRNDGSSAPIGAVIATPFSTAIPGFVSTAGVAVLIATPIIALLVAAAAIAYSQTITRPLARLTQASRVLAAGDYDTQVSVDAPGELGELAHSFNEMATQLKSDVDELHKQEAWRRELIMNITHDLATPLTAIAGLGEALVDGIDQSHEDYEATGRIIVRETLRLRRLVQDLHVMAKVEARALQPKLKPLRLAALIDETFATLATEFERRQIEPVNSVSYSLPLIEADPDMLTRVFSNLCNNSFHYTPAGGKVIIDAQQRDSLLVVSVMDTGEGIPEDALPRVFERFYRVDHARQSHIGGSGLGLAIVQAIVEVHGGKVWAESRPGMGACISFILPLQTVDDTQPPQPLLQSQMRLS